VTEVQLHKLSLADAVAAVVRLGDGRFLMQLRDARPDIWYPGTWGCFGGTVEGDESPIEALRRELREELEFELREAVPISQLDFDLRAVGLRKYFRAYFLVKLSNEELERLILHEGQRMAAFSYQELHSGIPVTPYDAFAIHLFHGRAMGAISG
jgi:8-oxo-dGTP pyrophosphatase MutT (NUDIX family)